MAMADLENQPQQRGVESKEMLDFNTFMLLTIFGGALSLHRLYLNYCKAATPWHAPARLARASPLTRPVTPQPPAGELTEGDFKPNLWRVFTL